MRRPRVINRAQKRRLLPGALRVAASDNINVCWPEISRSINIIEVRACLPRPVIDVLAPAEIAKIALRYVDIKIARPKRSCRQCDSGGGEKRAL